MVEKNELEFFPWQGFNIVRQGPEPVQSVGHFSWMVLHLGRLWPCLEIFANTKHSSLSLLEHCDGKKFNALTQEFHCIRQAAVGPIDKV